MLDMSRSSDSTAPSLRGEIDNVRESRQRLENQRTAPIKVYRSCVAQTLAALDSFAPRPVVDAVGPPHRRPICSDGAELAADGNGQSAYAMHMDAGTTARARSFSPLLKAVAAVDI